MNYREAKKVKVGDIVCPRMYAMDFRDPYSLRNPGYVIDINHDETNKQIVFKLKGGRKFEHTEITEVKPKGR